MFYKSVNKETKSLVSHEAVLSFEFDGDENGPTYELDCAPMGQ